MVHADASNFAPNITKEEALRQVIDQAEALFEGQRNWVCNLANTASLLWHAYKSLPEPSRSVNWAGFYTLHPSNPSQLILAPFQGKVACQTITINRGVCGTAAASGQTQLVRDVDNFPGHIACDGDSRSEIVVPIFQDNNDNDDVVDDGGCGNGTGGAPSGGEARRARRVVAVLDLDCTLVDGFDEVDRRLLEELTRLLGRSCDW